MDATEPIGGGKRKYKENALTAKAESGTLRVKILRKDQQQQQQQALLLAAAGAGSSLPARGARGASRTPAKSAAAPSSPDSPPKPRPNRKHVPIFYQQKRRPRTADGATDALSLSQFSSSSSASSAPPSDFSGSALSASTSSTGTAYAALLSGLQLDSASGSAGASSSSASVADLLPPPPAANPLFSRNDSDGLGALSELLRPHFPSASGPSFSLSGASSRILGPHMLLSAPMASSAASAASTTFIVDSIGSSKTASSNGDSFPSSAGSATALHQLAASSQHYCSALDALSAATRQSHRTETASSSLAPAPSPPVLTSLATDTHASSSALEETSVASEYKFNPLSALQTAIDHAQHLSQALAGKGEAERSPLTPSQAPTERTGAPSPPIDGSIQRLLDDGSDEDTTAAGTSGPLGPPPSAPPAFSLQNSLMGGGIEALASKKGGQSKPAASTPPLGTTSADGDLGPPPAAPPAFRIENSLMGGGIETQPMIANVNTHNFDWKFHKAAGKPAKPSSSEADAPLAAEVGGAPRDGEGQSSPSSRRAANL